MMNVGGQLSPIAHLQLGRMIRILGVYENGRHAERMRRLEIVWHVLEHGGRGGRYP